MENSKKGIAIGVDDFKQIIEQGSYFVDKSLFIKEIIDDASSVKLITRPRRFGKTLNISMLKYFFEKNGEDNSHLFKNLNIWKAGERYIDKQGKYPVIYLTLKEVKEDNISDCIESIKLKIIEEYIFHNYLLKNDEFDENDKNKYKDIISGKAGIVEYKNGLHFLSKLLYQYHKEQVIILIDEYDTPINQAFLKGYYDQAIDIMKVFLGAGLKGNEFLRTAVLTGIYRVAKESVFSDLNNPKICSILENSYCDKFGFIEEEVEEMIKYYDVESYREEVKEWYNGYIFGDDTVIYNPWSMINFMDNKKIKPYWVNTSSNDLIKEVMYKTDANIKKKIMLLIEGKAVEGVEVNTSINFRDILNRSVLSEEILWNFLIVSGYLKVENMEIIKGRTIADVRIPNLEILTLYEDMVDAWFSAEDTSSNMIKPMLESLVNGEIEEFEEDFRYLVEKTFSHFDVGRDKGENFYHAFTLGLLVNLEGKYRVISNRESGKGRADVLIIPKDKTKKGVIIEFKSSKESTDEAMWDKVAEALNQIEEKKYMVELESEGITDVVKIGIAFCGKEVAMGFGK